jgi:hypothetical protein
MRELLYSPMAMVGRRVLRRPVVLVRSKGVNSNDVLLASFPRSGNTWLRFLLFEALTRRAAQFQEVHTAIPYVFAHASAPRLVQDGRILKTHEIHGRIPCNAIYVVRDVRDVVLSEYRVAVRGGQSRRDFDSFLRAFLKGRTSVFGTWMDHVNHWTRPNMAEGRFLLLRYEDLRQDTEGVLRTILEFLGVGDASYVEAAVLNNSVRLMREKEKQAPASLFKTVRPNMHFIGEGNAGGWREQLNESQVRLIDRESGETLAQFGYEVGYPR